MGREDRYTRWGFEHTYRRAPAPDELAEYERGLHLERLRGFPDHWLTDADRADLASSEPDEVKRIFARLSESSVATCQPETPESLAPKSPKPRMPERPRALLRELLANGPKRGDLVEAAAARAEISKGALLGCRGQAAGARPAR